MRNKVYQLKPYKRLMAETLEVNRSRQAPACRNCLYYQPRFRYRKCLLASCPYGKGHNYSYRKRPLKKEKIIAKGGDMYV